MSILKWIVSKLSLKKVLKILSQVQSKEMPCQQMMHNIEHIKKWDCQTSIENQEAGDFELKSSLNNHYVRMLQFSKDDSRKKLKDLKKKLNPQQKSM